MVLKVSLTTEEGSLKLWLRISSTFVVSPSDIENKDLWEDAVNSSALSRADCEKSWTKGGPETDWESHPGITVELKWDFPSLSGLLPRSMQRAQ